MSSTLNLHHLLKRVASAALLRRSFLLAATFVTAVPAQAYIPPSEFILRTWVKKHSGAKDIKIKSHLTVYDNGAPVEPGLQVVTIFQVRNGEMDVTITGPSNLKVMAYTQKQVAPAGRLLFDPDFSRVSRAIKGSETPLVLKADLAQGEAPVEKTNLARSKMGISWVVGVPAETQVPQLWFEKDLFTPQRLIMKSGEGLRRIDFDSVRYFREFPILRNVQVKDANEKVLLKEEILEVQFSDSGFGRVSTSGNMDAIPAKIEAALREYDELLR